MINSDPLERLPKSELLRRLRQLEGEHVSPRDDPAAGGKESNGPQPRLQEIQEALERSRDRYAKLYDFAPVGYATLDINGLVESINLTGAKLLGIDRDRLIGLPMLQIIAPADRQQFMDVLLKCRQSEAEQSVDLLVKGKGATVPVQLTVHRAQSGGGPGTLRVAFTDMTSYRRVEQERHQARLYEQSARAAIELKDQLIAMVSHELRTPLSSMLLWSRILQLKLRGQPEYLQAVDAIIRSAESQRQLVDDLLDMSRITSGKLRLNFQNLDLQPLVAVSIEAVQPMASAKGVALETDLGAEEAVVYGDSERLQQIFWNLIVNAVNFTPSGGRVRVAVRQIGEDADIRVSDTGRGIEPDFLPHVFEAFRQGENAVTTRSHGGLGLGLAISRELVTQHKGTIHAASEGLGCGATFVVRLPLATGELKLRSSRRSNAEPLPWSRSDELVGIRILVVEDEPETRTALAAMVSDAGASVIAVDSAVSALAAFESARPDIVVSDIGMPNQDGYQLIQRLRALEISMGAKPVRALALTAFTRDSDRGKALAAGFNEHLGKPVEPAQLFTMLRQLIRDRRPAG